MPRRPPPTDMPTGEEYERIRAWVAASRARQGLPPTVTDPAILERAAAALRLVDPDDPRDDDGGAADG